MKSLALYLGLIALYLPSLSFGPLALDDQRQLAHAASPEWDLLAQDPFGHVRPVKQLVFQAAAHSSGDLTGLRAAILGLLLLCVALVQLHAARVSGSPLLGLAAAACFGFNPTMASVTCWLSSVNVLLCTALVLVYVELGARAGSGAGGSRVALGVALVALLFAMVSYELALLAPIALVLRFRVSTTTTTTTTTTRRLLFIGSAVCVVAVLALRFAVSPTAPSYRSATTVPWLLAASSARYAVENALLWLAPWNRFGVLLTDAPAQHLPASAACAVALVVAVALAFRFRARDPVLTFGLAWFALFLLPLCNLVPLGNTPVAMHYLCLPSVGLALALCRGAAHLLARTPPAVPAALLAAVCIAFVTATRPAIAAFGSESLLYARTLEYQPDNLEALVNLAGLALARGDHDRAAALLDRGQRIAPHDPGVVRNRFVLLIATHRLPEALALLEAQPTLSGDPGMLSGKGEVLAQLGRHAEAAAAFERAYQNAARGGEERFAAGYQLLVTYLTQRDLDRARPLLSRLLAEYPDREELVPARALLSSTPRP